MFAPLIQKTCGSFLILFWLIPQGHIFSGVSISHFGRESVSFFFLIFNAIHCFLKYILCCFITHLFHLQYNITMLLSMQELSHCKSELFFNSFMFQGKQRIKLVYLNFSVSIKYPLVILSHIDSHDNGGM